jgi:hypothetical protein
MTNLTITLVLIAISITIGFLIGVLVYGLRGKPKPPAADKDSLAPAQGVRLWRDPLTQSLTVEVDGKTYERVTDLPPETRSQQVRLARDWLLWLGMPASRLAALVNPASQGTVEPPQTAQTVAGRGSTARAQEVKTTPKSVKMAEKGKAESTQQSIAAQIDEILQARIENSPLAERGIKIQELPGQGMVVMVGVEKYPDLSMVPDREVRDAIAAAVAEWEKKNASWG